MGATKADLLKLYGRVLRKQSSLPKEMQVLGHEYIRHEFREHYKKCSNGSSFLATFLLSWNEYLDTVSGLENIVITDANKDQQKRLQLLERAMKS